MSTRGAASWRGAGTRDPMPSAFACAFTPARSAAETSPAERQRTSAISMSPGASNDMATSCARAAPAGAIAAVPRAIAARLVIVPMSLSSQGWTSTSTGPREATRQREGEL